MLIVAVYWTTIVEEAAVDILQIPTQTEQYCLLPLHWRSLF